MRKAKCDNQEVAEAVNNLLRQQLDCARWGCTLVRTLCCTRYILTAAPSTFLTKKSTNKRSNLSSSRHTQPSVHDDKNQTLFLHNVRPEAIHDYCPEFSSIDEIKNESAGVVLSFGDLWKLYIFV